MRARLGLSRNAYLRRRLRQDAERDLDPKVTAADLVRFGERFADLARPRSDRQGVVLSSGGRSHDVRGVVDR